MSQELALGVGFALLTLGLVAGGHALATARSPVFGALSVKACGMLLGILGALTVVVAAPTAQSGDTTLAGVLVLLGTVVVGPAAAAALLALPQLSQGVRVYSLRWAGGLALTGAAALVTSAAVQALSPAAGSAGWWQLLAPRSPLSYAIAAASVFALLRGTTELVRFVRTTRTAYLPQRSRPVTRMSGWYYLSLTVACGGVGLMLAAGIALKAAQEGDRASVPLLLLQSLPSIIALGLAAFLARFVAATEPSARVFTLLCLLFAVAGNQAAPPAWGTVPESLRFAALILAAPVTLHFALLFPQQDEALPRAVAVHWSWRRVGGVQVPWLVYLPMAVCLPVAAGLPLLSQMGEPSVALLGVVAGTYLLTTLAPTVAAYALGRTWASLREGVGPPEAVQRVRLQLAWVALGGLLSAAGSLVWTLLGPLLSTAFAEWSATVYWACALLLPLGVTPAIVRHGLWDVQRLLNYALVHTLTLAAVGLLESAVFGTADALIKATLEDLQLPDYFGRGAALLAAGAIYTPLKRVVKKHVDGAFARWLRWPARGSG